MALGKQRHMASWSAEAPTEPLIREVFSCRGRQVCPSWWLRIIAIKNKCVILYSITVFCRISVVSSLVFRAVLWGRQPRYVTPIFQRVN